MIEMNQQPLLLTDCYDLDFSISQFSGSAASTVQARCRGVLFASCGFTGVNDLDAACVITDLQQTGVDQYPANISFIGCSFEAGIYGLRILYNNTSSDLLTFSGCLFFNNYEHGVFLGSNTTGSVEGHYTFTGCVFSGNGQNNASSASYDMVFSSQVNYLSLSGCMFTTPIGTSDNEVTASLDIASTNHVVIVGGSFPQTSAITNTPLKSYGAINQADT